MKSFRNLSFVFFTFFLTLNKIDAASSEPVFGENGMVVCTSKLASEIGIEVLKKGGNAIDAAVAIGFALSVTSSSNGNLGGGGFLVAVMPDGEKFSLDFREKAPASATKNMFLDDKDEVLNGLSLNSLASSGVPGSVDGLLKVLKDYGSGKISRRQILAPAIRLANNGFPLSHHEARRLNIYKDFFKKNEEASKIFVRRDGKPWRSGDKLIQKDLARTLRKISTHGRSGFYEGDVADLIVKEMKNGNGIITYKDLENYSSKYRTPVQGNFHDYEILSMGPPSSGGVLLINMLNMLENFRLDTLGWNSSNYVHLLTEVERRAYADRAEHLGDPDFWNVPTSTLISKKYALSRIKNISLKNATPSTSVFPLKNTSDESIETTHYSVVDSYGSAVSVTTTINLSYGSGIVVTGAGFFLNNEMDDFSSKPGQPNAFDLIGNEANSIQPGKRPLSSMTPTIVLKNGKPSLVIGSPGGSTIITTTMQVILNVVVFGMDIKEAVCSPRFHSQWYPDLIMIEPRGFSKDVMKNLNLMGHKIVPYKWGYIGEANGIYINEDGFFGGGDDRGETSAIGY